MFVCLTPQEPAKESAPKGDVDMGDAADDDAADGEEEGDESESDDEDDAGKVDAGKGKPAKRQKGKGGKKQFVKRTKGGLTLKEVSTSTRLHAQCGKILFTRLSYAKHGVGMISPERMDAHRPFPANKHRIN